MRAVAPAVYITMLLSSGNVARGVVVKGIDPALEAKRNEALERIVSGAADFAPDKDGFDAIVVGKILADEMHLRAGDYVTLTSPSGQLTPFGMVPRSKRFRIAGIFDSGFYDYDANWGFVTLAASQNMAGVGDVASVLEFRIADVDRAGEMATRLAHDAGEGFLATTWMDENRALFRALRLEKIGHGAFHWSDHVRRGTEYSGGAGDDRKRSGARHCGVDGHGRAARTDRAHFCAAGPGGGRVGNGRGAGRRLRICLGRGNLPTHPAGPASVFGSVRSVSSERGRRAVDFRGGSVD